MRISKFICSVAVLAVTVSSSPAKWFDLHWIEGRASDAATLVNARANPQLRIMVAGASIASGYLSSDGNGFRLGLEEALVAAGNDVQMVGTVRTGTMKDNAYEAKPGLRIDEVIAKVDAALPKISPLPNIVLVQVGANDLGQNFKVDTMQDRISTLVDHLYAAIPDVNVVLSTLLPSGKTESGVLVYNAKLRGVVEAQNKKDRHVYLADVHSSDFSMADILPLPDGTHPTDAGYAKMAQVYANVVLEIVKARFAPPITSTSSQTTNASPNPVSEAPTQSSSSSQAQKQVASATSTSATMSTATQIAKELPSSTTVSNLPASTSNSASTPSTSAPPKNGSVSSFSQPGSLITAVIMLAWAVPLFAI
ncbi:SGNH hydrolase-type esterase domain-containing protein [Rhexocercosporidium sp. MPI-PUGE-AT-0058]|nr:SGNH hydrolase-type esterase domain-containing protein [Rhexocercosporidium sp. MPI-PUGE-AT-0058]